MKSSTRFACIGWGSLIWDPRTLATRGEWHLDGPALPVEFGRESEGQKITLVICPSVERMNTRWILMEVPSISEARQNLGTREYEKAKQPWIEQRIGYWDRANGFASGAEKGAIAAWAAKHDLDGVVWTDLPVGFKTSKEVMPSVDEILTHLKTLVGDQREKAEDYIRRAPPEINTRYRQRIEQELGWTYRP